MRGCRPLSDEEVEQVAGAFAGPWALRDRALFVLGCRTGYRITELLSLTVGDLLGPEPATARPVGPEAIADRVTVARRRMKAKRQGRSVVIHPRARPPLAAWLEELRGRGLLAASTPVFCSRNRRRAPKAAPRLPFAPDTDDPPPSAEASAPPDLRPLSIGQAWRILKAAFRRCGVYGATGTHSMRKTFASRVYGRSRDLVTTQRALGHRNIASTMAYLSAAQDDVDRAILGED